MVLAGPGPAGKTIRVIVSLVVSDVLTPRVYELVRFVVYDAARFHTKSLEH